MKSGLQRTYKDALAGSGMEALSLRERKRLRRHRAIIFSAAELFSGKGFTETTMEDIASSAEISPPTIYNYFRSKSDILLGLLEVDKELMDEALDAIIENPTGDALEILCEFVRTDLESGYDIRQKYLWRMISAAALEATGEQSSAYRQVQSVFCKKLQRLIKCLQQNGKIDPAVDPAIAAIAINSVTRESFRMYISSADLTIDEMLATARDQLTLLWHGLKPTGTKKGET